MVSPGGINRTSWMRGEQKRAFKASQWPTRTYSVLRMNEASDRGLLQQGGDPEKCLLNGCSKGRVCSPAQSARGGLLGADN